MWRFTASWAIVALGAVVCEAGVEIRVAEGRVDIRATGAPLTEVLERLSKQTGMKVVYDGAPPSRIITATLEGRTPAEAVLGILEGLGLNYALRMDAAGTRVETLMMAGTAPLVRGQGPPHPAPTLAPPPPQPPPEEEEFVEEDVPEPEPPPPPPQPGRPEGAPQGAGEGIGAPPSWPPPAGFQGAPQGFPASPFAPTKPPAQPERNDEEVAPPEKQK